MNEPSGLEIQHCVGCEAGFEWLFATRRLNLAAAGVCSRGGIEPFATVPACAYFHSLQLATAVYGRTRTLIVVEVANSPSSASKLRR